MTINELHVYDFDDTLYRTPPWDPDGVNTRYLQLFMARIKTFVVDNKDRFNGLDYKLFDLNNTPVLDRDLNPHYEIMYDNKKITTVIYTKFNRKIRDYILFGPKVGGDAKHDSYYVKPDVNWYEIPKSLENYKNCIIETTRHDFDISLSRDDVYTIIMTGRKERLRKYVQNILDSNNIKPDELILSPGGSTKLFKVTEIINLLRQYQSIKKVYMWEDKLSYIDFYKNKFAELNIVLEIKLVPKYYLQEYISNFLHVMHK